MDLRSCKGWASGCDIIEFRRGLRSFVGYEFRRGSRIFIGLIIVGSSGSHSY